MRVGSLTRFGNSAITAPAGLAWDDEGKKLYMVDDATNALYTLNTTTGTATRVGSANQFGLSINSPRGLTWDGPRDDDYELVLLTPTTMYKLNKTTGIARVFNDLEIGSPTTLLTSNFGAGITDAVGIAARSKRLFMVDNATDRLYVIDRFSRLASRIGGKLIDTTNPSGLEAVGSTLYMGSTSPKGLYTISRSSGKASLFQNISIASVSGLAWNGSTMYAVDNNTDALYTLPRVQAPTLPAPSADTDRYPYLPDEGDLYYNGDTLRTGIYPSHTFVDTTMRWINPSWWSTRTRTTRDLCEANPISCANYEHDLVLDRRWVRSSCTSWSNLPQSYDDCPTAGIRDGEGKVIVSFGTFKAPDIETNQVYYGAWKFTSSATFRFTNPQSTAAELLCQEGDYNGFYYITLPFVGRVDILAAVCPRKMIVCVNSLRQEHLAPPAKSGGGEVTPFRWTRGASFYSTYRR